MEIEWATVCDGKNCLIRTLDTIFSFSFYKYDLPWKPGLKTIKRTEHHFKQHSLICWKILHMETHSFFLLLPIWARADLDHLCLRSKGHWAKIKIYKHELENRHFKSWSAIRRKRVRWKTFCISNDCGQLLSSLLVNTLNATLVEQKPLF